tara:strand:- start:75875 stop:76816 length:942 start_codon:yes stop_codon:yes gene_type:complete
VAEEEKNEFMWLTFPAGSWCGDIAGALCINAFLTGRAQIQARLAVNGPLMRISFFAIPLAALVLTACATTARTDDEQALAAELDARSIVPSTSQERSAIRSQDMLTQATFWAEAHELNPSDLEAAYELSNALRQLGNPQRAIEIAQQSLALHPGSPQLLLAYGTALTSTGRGTRATESLRRASQADPTNWRIFNTLGVAYEQGGQPDQARQSFRTALALSPGEASVMSNLALSHALSGEAETAEAMLREAMIRPGAEAAVRQNLALVIALQGRFAEAEEVARYDVTPAMAESNMAYVRAMLTSRRSYDSLRGD